MNSNSRTYPIRVRPRRRYAIECPDATTLSVRDAQVLADAGAILERYLVHSTRPVFDSPHITRKYLQLHYAALSFEVFGCLYLDNRHRLIAHEQLFHGTIDGASVHPRRVVTSALAHGAAAVIFVHPHPSGVAEPSTADECITRRLREALSLVDIRVVDHFIIAGNSVTSFAERGLI